MKQNQRNAAAAAWAIAFVLALSGCGGGGGGGSSAATLATTDDSSSVLWNAPATIDVLVNDSSSQGTVGLVDVTAPSHGTASIAGGRIVYTPAPGYFGPDSMRYTARAAQGGATATATLAVDVRARFNLQGTVGEGATPGAEVVVQLGSTSTTTTADSQGRYSVTLESNQPDAFVDIQATGGASQPTIKLRSLVGRLGALLAGADAQGTVSAAQHRALDVDAFSTATAVLAMRASGNQLPVTDALFAQIDSELLFDMATVMKKLLTGAAVLPTGAADSLALLGDATAFDAYRTSLTTADYTSFAAVRQAVLAGLAFVAPDPVAVNGEQTLIYFGENKTWQDATYVVAFRPNGTATVHSEGGHVAATWSRTAQKIEVAFSSPLSHFAVVDVETAPATAWIRSSGLVIRKIDGLPGFNTVTVPTTQEYAPGEDRAGEIVTLVAASDAGNLLRRVDQADRLPIAQGEFAVGARWAGFIDFSSFDSQVDYQTGMLPIRQDLVTVTSSGHARSSVSAIDYTYTVADNRLFVGGINGAIVEYVRLRTDSATGEQRWLAMARGGTLGWVSSMVVVSADSSPASLTVAEAARNWSTYAEWDGSFDIALYADGTGLETFGGGGDAPSSRACTWSVSAADGISMARRVFNRTRYRVWLPVKRQAGALWVLETQYDLTDLDPTVPQSLIQRVSRKVDRGTTAP